MNNVEVCEYQTTEGKAPLTEWLASVRDGAPAPALLPDWIGSRRDCSVIGRMSAVASVN
jgi:hypothetical protein